MELSFKPVSRCFVLTKEWQHCNNRLHVCFMLTAYHNKSKAVLTCDSCKQIRAPTMQIYPKCPHFFLFVLETSFAEAYFSAFEVSWTNFIVIALVILSWIFFFLFSVKVLTGMEALGRRVSTNFCKRDIFVWSRLISWNNWKKKTKLNFNRIANIYVDYSFLTQQ